MKFNFWLVIFLGLMPAFILFTGLSAAGGFQSAAELQVIGTVLAAALVAGYLAKRRGDEISEETAAEVTAMKDPSIPVGESDHSNEPSDSLPPGFLHDLNPSHLGYLNREETLVPALRRTFDNQERNVSVRAPAVQTTSLLADAQSDARLHDDAIGQRDAAVHTGRQAIEEAAA